MQIEPAKLHTFQFTSVLTKVECFHWLYVKHLNKAINLSFVIQSFSLNTDKQMGLKGCMTNGSAKAGGDRKSSTMTYHNK